MYWEYRNENLATQLVTIGIFHQKCKEWTINIFHLFPLTLVTCFSCITWMTLALVGSHTFSMFTSVLTNRCGQKDSQYHLKLHLSVTHIKTWSACTVALRNITHIAIGNKNKSMFNKTLRILCRKIHRKHCFGTLAACINNSLFALVILMNLGHAEFSVHLTCALWLITSHIWIGKQPGAPECQKLLRSGMGVVSWSWYKVTSSVWKIKQGNSKKA